MSIATIEGAVARPLKELVHLIKDAINEAHHAAEQAAAPYWLQVGQMMLEAKGQLSHGEFRPWIERNFNIGYVQASRYMKVANTTTSEEMFRRRNIPSLTEAIRQASPNAVSYAKENQTIRPQPWHNPIKETLNKVDTQFLNTRRDEVNRAEEREAQRKLALQLIDIGYKALASKLHPDKGGSRDAMARLNAVRDRLKGSV
jgi:hypothetical protein